ncbi:cation:proton antiporter [Conexibacter sp. JD483]|uniref:cation:proton antiporter n=1 Tax=unclassified Conexibacter TaxID=2627773 RepID=UPI00271A5E3C|nr:MULTISPECIES: cation:proton antiporter [unclassified Conexibacter]MDO8187001.1 cation:proton antiporter [Conexibacter sp. CPCC 205706]MDO8200681.1 cation:proton antiporter [Conexibacter sp. CPCC 205762]MDR9371494.1 cation:proton antiporter [Conexibacter sp. JD483]
MDDELLGLALVVVLAVGAQLLAARLVIPAIVPLLVVGVLAGDVFELIDPQQLLGPAFTDAISIAVGIILFEGALGLRREELAGPVRGVVARLCSVGALVTWVCSALLVDALLDVSHAIAILIGAIVIVSGPTVVLPMLDFIRPVARVRSLLKWEGIVVDPVGAICAVIAFDALDFSGGGVSLRLGDFGSTVLAGLACGAAGALVLMPLLQARWLAERQKVAATLMAVVAAFAAADLLRDDAGLVAAIAMGIALANQRRVEIERIVEFKETLGAILLGLLFILLSATVDLTDVIDLGAPALLLVVLLVLVVRPLGVALSTVRSDLPWRERLMLMALAPRGIVAASTASVFGLELQQQGAPGADMIVPVVFTVIAGTVVVYAVLGPLAARLLGLAHGEPAGVLIVGAAPWARALARALATAGAEVRLWSPHAEEAAAARAEGLTVCADPLLGDGAASDDPLDEAVGLVLVTTADDAFNELLVERLSQELGTARVLALPAGTARPQLLARDGGLEPPLFGAEASALVLERRFAAGARVRARAPGDPAEGLPLAVVRESSRNGALAVHPFTGGAVPPARPGDVLLDLV